MAQQPADPTNRDQWRALMYDTGWNFSGADATGAFTPYFEQNWQLLPIPPGEEKIQYFYVYGGEDRKSGWPNNGWRRNMLTGGQYDPATAPGTRGESLRIWYTGGWNDAYKNGVNLGATKVANPALAQYVKIITPAEALAEYNQGFADQQARRAPPLLGFSDPPGTAGTGSAQPVVDPRSLAAGGTPAAQAAGGGLGLLGTLLPIALLKGFNQGGTPSADQRAGTYEQGYRDARRGSRRKRKQSDEYNEGYDDFLDQK
jgi:hypothetical protein